MSFSAAELTENVEQRIEKFIDKQKELILIEKKHQLYESSVRIKSVAHSQLQKEGLCLLNLQLVGSRSGLGGKLLVEFESAIGVQLPTSCKIKCSDVVRLVADESVPAEKATIDGVVYRINQKSITVALNDSSSEKLALLENCSRIKIFQSPNDVAFERFLKILEVLRSSYTSNAHIKYFFTSFPSAAAPDLSKTNITFFNPNLNKTQQDLVAKIVSVSRPEPLYLIHGPPGTGKTMTLVEIILQLMQKNVDSILVCGPSNISVDNLMERVAATQTSESKGWRLIRLGHPARMLESTAPFSLSQQLATSEAGHLINDIHREIDDLVKKLFFSKGKQPDRRSQLDLLKSLRSESRQREANALKSLVESRCVIFSTLTGAASSQLKAEKQFDYVIIDESTQALQAECWIAMCKAKRTVILAGDHLQLPPTVTSPDAAEKGLTETCFDRISKINPHLITMLNIQYRMNILIMQWSSKEFYNSKLEAHETVANHTLWDLVSSSETLSFLEDFPDRGAPLLLIDTADCPGYNEMISADAAVVASGIDDSKYNAGEAQLAFDHMKILVSDLKISPSAVAIITPYNAQVSFIRTLIDAQGDLFAGVEVGTVDGFQGREKECIVFSFVRSNDKHEIGFLKESRRTNVAVTRAKRQICIVGDSNTLNRHSFYKRLIEHFVENGSVIYPE